MKFQKFSLLLVPALLMSCSTGIKGLTIEEGRSVVSAFNSASYTNYTVNASIQIAAQPIAINSYVTDPTSPEVLTTDAGNTDSLANNIANLLVSSSYYLGIPLKLDTDNFFKVGKNATNENDIKGVDKTNSVYGLIHSIVIFEGTVNYDIVLEETETGGLSFSVTNSYNYLTISNVNSFPSLDIYNVGNYAGRFNATFEYNNEGYLVKEQVVSVNYDETKAATDSSMLYLLSTYQYL